MPKATMRASAKALPKSSPSLTDEFFALVEKCEAAGQRYDATGDALEEAEKRHYKIEPPPEVFKTEDDARMRLFVGGAVGEVYRRAEVEVIAAICRNLGRSTAGGTRAAYNRCRSIIEAWKKWTARKEAEDAKSGLEAADRADTAARDEAAIVVAKLALTRALTTDQIIAKARALSLFVYADNVTNVIEELIDEESPLDREVVALSLMLDLVTLAKEARA